MSGCVIDPQPNPYPKLYGAFFFIEKNLRLKENGVTLQSDVEYAFKQAPSHTTGSFSTFAPVSIILLTFRENLQSLLSSHLELPWVLTFP